MFGVTAEKKQEVEEKVVEEVQGGGSNNEHGSGAGSDEPAMTSQSTASYSAEGMAYLQVMSVVFDLPVQKIQEGWPPERIHKLLVNIEGQIKDHPCGANGYTEEEQKEMLRRALCLTLECTPAELKEPERKWTDDKIVKLIQEMNKKKAASGTAPGLPLPTARVRSASASGRKKAVAADDLAEQQRQIAAQMATMQEALVRIAQDNATAMQAMTVRIEAMASHGVQPPDRSANASSGSP